MPNPLGSPGIPQNGGGKFGNAFNMLQSFQQFKSSFHGDPKQQVQQLLNSGQMSQDQFNNLVQIAKQLQSSFFS